MGKKESIIMKYIRRMYVSIIPLLLPGSALARKEATAVPEPSTILLLGFAIIGLGAFLFWKARKGRK